MISPLIELNDDALTQAQQALSEYLCRQDVKYAASVCVSAYLIELEKKKEHPPTFKVLEVIDP